MNPQLEQLIALMRRYPYCVVCAALTLALGVGCWFLWQDIDQLEVAHEERAKEGEAMLTLLVGGSIQRQELMAAHDAARRIEDNLAIETELPENNQYFYNFEGRTKATLLDLNPLNAPAADASRPYKRIPYTLRIAGEYEQVAAFLVALETGPRLVNITSFNFARRAIAGGGAGGGSVIPAASGDTVSTNGVVLDLNLELLGKNK